MAPVSPTVRRRQLGRELKRLREAAGKTREEAAQHLEMSVPAIGRYETGAGGIRPKAVMRAQLERLVEIGEWAPNVTLQVLPFEAGAYPGMLGTFVILSFDDPVMSPDIVYVEGATGDQFLEGAEARPYSLQFNGLRA